MLNKIFVIAYNGLYRTYIDRVALLYMFLAPVAISLIMGLVFGGGTDDIALPEADILLINQDEGFDTGLQTFNFGEEYEAVLVTNPPEEIHRFITAELADNTDDARQQVEDGDQRAVVIIPPDFTQNVLNPATQGELEIYYNPSSEISATIVISVLESITSQINTSVVAQNLYAGSEEAFFVQLSDGNLQTASEAADTAVNAIAAGEMADILQLEDVNFSGKAEELNLISYFAPAMAILFMAFTMAAGARTMLQEQRNWTMQRILTTPTPRWVYMSGRMVGNYTAGFSQMLILLIVTPLISAIAGSSTDVWGSNIVGIALITIAVVWASTGLGTLIASISAKPEDADVYANAILFAMAIIGGSFVPVDGVPILNILSRFTFNYWGIDGYFRLATDDAALGDIVLNIAALLAMGGVFFAAALWQFNRRVDF